MKDRKFYVTTPLYYVNAKPHVGTLYSTVLADVTARFRKLLLFDVFFLTGTDEHGQKIEQKAREHGKEPETFVKGMIEPFKAVWKLYGCDYDSFIRTTSSEHKAAVDKLITVLSKNDDIYKSTYSGQYCTPCEMFVTIDDQTPQDESGYLCPSCGREITSIEEENYFFRLSAYQDSLLDFYEKNPDFIAPKERFNEVISFVKSGLEDLSISRRGVSWGIPFPDDSSHTVYVWVDALINYITAVGYGEQGATHTAFFNKWWPADVHIMAKDIVRFHAVYWPAFLMAVGLEMPRRLLVHGYILSGDGKMSKSKGNVLDPVRLADQYGAEAIRYYLLRHISVHQDGQFGTDELRARIASDLANSLGNLLRRTISLAMSNDYETVSPPDAWADSSEELFVACHEAYRSYCDNMMHYEYHSALADVWKFISEVNVYFNNQRPWELAKTNKELFVQVLSATLHSLYAIGIMCWPVMPGKSEDLLDRLGHTFNVRDDYDTYLRTHKWEKTFTVTKKDEPLFIRPEGPEGEE